MQKERAMAERLTYPLMIKIVHWLTAALVLCLIPLGVSLDYLPEGAIRNQGYFLHKSLGALVLLLTLLRIGLRVGLGAPAPAAVLTRFESFAAQAAHAALYGLLLFMPLIGWLGASAFGAPADFFGLFELPQLVSKDMALAKTCFRLHTIGAILLSATLVAHIGGAILHMRRKDGVIQRMI
jgi:cytochrome b561